MTITGAATYQHEVIAKTLASCGATSTSRDMDGNWTLDGRPATPAEAAKLTKIAKRFGYNLLTRANCRRGNRIGGTPGQIHWTARQAKETDR